MTSLQSLFGTSKLFQACKVNRLLLNLSMEKVLNISYKIEARFSRTKKSSILASIYPLECGGGDPVISPWCSPAMVPPSHAEEHLFLTAFCGTKTQVNILVRLWSLRLGNCTFAHGISVLMAPELTP